MKKKLYLPLFFLGMVFILIGVFLGGGAAALIKFSDFLEITDENPSWMLMLGKIEYIVLPSIIAGVGLFLLIYSWIVYKISGGSK